MSLIRTSFLRSCLTFEWSEFWKVPYVSFVISVPSGAIFGGANNEMTNTMMSHIYMYKKLEGDQRLFKESKSFFFFIEITGRIGGKCD